MEGSSLRLSAAGFNAHRQLKFTEEEEASQQSSNYSSYRTIATSSKSPSVAFAGWSYTILQVDDQLHLLGHHDNQTPPTDETTSSSQATPIAISLPQPTSSLPEPSAQSLKFFGTPTSPLGALTPSGHLLLLLHRPNRSAPILSLTPASTTPQTSPKFSAIALTSTGTLCAAVHNAPASSTTHLLQFPSFDTFEAWYLDPSGDVKPTHFQVPGRCAQLAGMATGFVYLSHGGPGADAGGGGGGEVFTWGDARHAACLGRAVGAEAPADKPGVVEALLGVGVGKVAVGSWMVAALSEGDGAAYVWGKGRPNAVEPKRINALPGEGDEDVRLVEVGVGEGEDELGMSVEDVGVGGGHVVVLAEGGRVFVAGENGNGQLGLGEGADDFVEDWSEVEEWKGRHVAKVWCGVDNSFVLATYRNP
ncbi:hypothetical protein LTS18_004045 [Coniosporium uncinatum]|uniref:Uncharacterized protein n=1 Tax=Coniosporium uncinatum TaxID=93489 RepID=A0ACC3DBE3_9PEZI|nr:hypothetical protein LTS18_004045 [Coniosporium uncinatum]